MVNTSTINARVGVVVIGRNEGERLIRCLKSIDGFVKSIVYVDSGSTDDSIMQARNLGVEVVELDLRTPFSAARARNEGFAKLKQMAPCLEYVQFVDGDCEVQAEWLAIATEYLENNAAVAVVCGRRRERFPENSIYNLMCDSEWNTPIGEAKACGGDALMRLEAFQAVDGYRNQLIAGEEPELCVRLRGQGWKIWRIDEEMTLHDAALTKFRQWWRRTMRGGYAFAEGAYLHGASPERHWVKESRRAWVWGLLIPIFGLLLASVSWVYGLLILMAYILQIFRIVLRNKRQKDAYPWARAFFMVLGKFPEMLGQVKFQYQRLIGRSSKLIEYK